MEHPIILFTDTKMGEYREAVFEFIFLLTTHNTANSQMDVQCVGHQRTNILLRKKGHCA